MEIYFLSVNLTKLLSTTMKHFLLLPIFIILFINASAQVADLEIGFSTVTPTTANVGEIVSLLINVKNSNTDCTNGSITATGVSAKVYIPYNLLSIDASSTSGNYDPATQIWTIGAISPDEIVNLVMNFYVADNSTNTFYAEVFTSDLTDCDSQVGNLSGSPSEDDELSITITGQSSDCTVNVSNIVCSDATKDLSFDLTLNGANDLPIVINASSQVIISNPTNNIIKGSPSVEGILIDQFPINEDLVSSPQATCADLTATSVYLSGSIVNIGCSNTPLEVHFDGVDLALDFTVDNISGSVGDEFIFTMEVHNKGPETATGVVVYLDLNLDDGKDGLLFLSSMGDGSFDNNDDWAIPSMDAGETVQLIVHTKATLKGNITFDGQVYSENQEYNTADDYNYIGITVNGLNCSASVNDVICDASNNLSFDLTVTNDADDQPILAQTTASGSYYIDMIFEDTDPNSTNNIFQSQFPPSPAITLIDHAISTSLSSQSPPLTCNDILGHTFEISGSSSNDIIDNVCDNDPLVTFAPIAIPDNTNTEAGQFDVTQSACIDLYFDAAADACPDGVKIKLEHSWQGDLHAYIIGSTGITLSLFSRPDGVVCDGVGNDSDLDPADWIYFLDDGQLDSETVNGSLNNGVIYTTGMGSLTNAFSPAFADCVGDVTSFAALCQAEPLTEDKIVKWKICVSDHANQDTGALHDATFLRKCEANETLTTAPPNLVNVTSTINSTAVIDLPANNPVIYRAKTAINLNSGFEVVSPSVFLADPKTCVEEN